MNYNDLGKTRVVVVEDERHIARFLEFVLKKEGYEVAIAYSGEQGLEVIKKFKPAALLLDFVLPGMSGLDVINHLRADEEFSDLIIVVLTARSFEENQRDLLEGGANASCAKPIAPTTLIKVLTEFGLSPRSRAIEPIAAEITIEHNL
jgi:two-component system, OmpR family, phosphate regulon response regulator PhoB